MQDGSPAETHAVLNVKCLLLMPDFNQNENPFSGSRVVSDR
jgi:hypothetical protein